LAGRLGSPAEPAKHAANQQDGGVIDSPANAHIKAALRLRDRRERETTGMTLVDGGRESLRAIDAGAHIETAFVCRERLGTPDAAAAATRLEDQAAAVVDVSPRAFERLAYGDRADGVILVVKVRSTTLGSLHLPKDSLVIVTEDVEKPGNVGAILRSADGAGAAAVIAVGGTDLFNPNVIRASVGTVFAVPVAAASADETAAWLRGRDLRVVASVVDAPRLHVEADLRGPLAIVLGSEASGLSPAWRTPDVEAVRLPMEGVADSLNVSAAAAVLLYEAWRQRRAPVPPSGSPTAPPSTSGTAARESG
jgi:TrmH family RNA methyltransferase